ncbi:CaiB/BaiF CoA transferase family protein [Nocardia vaccinii]|uniref:CaiB/BaiF CoA transferase family protein n=1 Tax=Nocardia vaccinii TaxID=1822 RepID=UPI002480CBBE|nr:CaiB/BaiF CoA-transferase family protein [Nocardia vaccinii]
MKIVELAGIGPGPFAGMVLADMGADVVRVSRPGDTRYAAAQSILERGRRSVVVDLKAEGGAEVVLRLVENADGLIEGFRPGVAERLGVGPEPCLERNPRLVYGRITGWGQHGPLAHTAGHDIDYIALTGALYSMGHADRPPAPPLNLVGDFGGGGYLLAYGLVCGLFDALRSGKGQVVDAAIVDGTAVLLANLFGMRSQSLWTAERGANLLDGSRPEYSTYECSDGTFIAVGALESQFYDAFIDGLGLEDPPDRRERDQLRTRIAERFLTRSRDEWMKIFEGTDACVVPVLTPAEAATHPHLTARETYLEVNGVTQPAAAPRFSRTPGRTGGPAPELGADTRAILREVGYDDPAVGELIRTGVVAALD